MKSVMILLSLFFAATSQAAPPPAPAQAPTPAPASSPAQATDSPMESILTEDMIRSLRDPFQIPMIFLSQKEKPRTDLEMFQLSDFRLNGVITGPKKTKAMVTGPNGKTYFISVGDRIGIRSGHVTSIRPDAIKVVEYDIDEKGRRTPEIFEIKITGEVQALSQKEE